MPTSGLRGRPALTRDCLCDPNHVEHDVSIHHHANFAQTLVVAQARLVEVTTGISERVQAALRIRGREPGTRTLQTSRDAQRLASCVCDRYPM